MRRNDTNASLMDRKESALYTNNYNLKKKKKNIFRILYTSNSEFGVSQSSPYSPVNATHTPVLLLDLGPPIRTSVQNDRAENTPLGKNPERDRASRPTRDDVKTVYVGTPHARLGEYYTIPDIRDPRTDR